MRDIDFSDRAIQVACYAIWPPPLLPLLRSRLQADLLTLQPRLDVDVLVIGEPGRDAVDDAARRAPDRLGREVNITIRSARWWKFGADGFRAEISRRPLISVFEIANAR